MRRGTLLLLLLLVLTGCTHLSASDAALQAGAAKDLASPAQSEPFPITYGDMLEVTVWGEDSLNRRLLVRPDGYISYPLAGDVKVVGLRVSEVSAILTDKLKEYMPDAPVSVTLFEARGSMVYVVGKVQRPGAFPMSGPVTPVQALALAGGPTPFASESCMWVVRNLPDGTQKSYPYNYKRTLSGTTDQELYMQPGDTLLVP